jgi:hypothetical protein
MSEPSKKRARNDVQNDGRVSKKRERVHTQTYRLLFVGRDGDHLLFETDTQSRMEQLADLYWSMVNIHGHAAGQCLVNYLRGYDVDECNVAFGVPGKVADFYRKQRPKEKFFRSIITRCFNVSQVIFMW